MALATAVNDAAGREPTGRSADVTVGKDLGQSQHLGDADSQQQRHDSLGWLWLKLAQGCLEEAHAWLGLSFALRHHSVGPPPVLFSATLEPLPTVVKLNCPVRSNDALLVGRISEETGSAGGAAPPRILIFLGSRLCVVLLAKEKPSSQPIQNCDRPPYLCSSVDSTGRDVVQRNVQRRQREPGPSASQGCQPHSPPRPAAGTELEKRKQERAHTARFIETQTSKVASSASSSRNLPSLRRLVPTQLAAAAAGLPTSIELESLVSSRAFQIQSFLRSIKSAKSATTTRAWQLLPRHARGVLLPTTFSAFPPAPPPRRSPSFAAAQTQARTRSDIRNGFPATASFELHCAARN